MGFIGNGGFCYFFKITFTLASNNILFPQSRLKNPTLGLTMKYLNIKDIQEDTQVSRKQINNRIRKVIHHNKLVSGGGRGRGGKYLIHPLLWNYLTAPNYYSGIVYDGSQQKILNNLDTFKLLNWRWFHCFSPKGYFELNNLFDKMRLNDGDIAYYSVHARKSSNDLHLHYVVTDKENLYSKKNSTNFFKPYAPSLGDSCFNYFNNPSDNQYLVEVGYLLGVKHHDRFDRIRLN